MRTPFTIAIMIAAALVAGCSPSPAVTPPHDAASRSAPPTTIPAKSSARGVEAAAATIPWAQVGSGWVLATWTAAITRQPGEPYAPGEPDPATAARTLFLVDPAGTRYAITTFPANVHGQPTLTDWSSDGSHALFFVPDATTAASIVVDLHTGAQTAVPVDGAAKFARPDGTALLVTTHSADYRGPSFLKRVDLNGRQELLYPTDKLTGQFSGRYARSADDTQLVLGTSTGLALMGADGTAGAMIAVPGQRNCDPVRWWDDPATPKLLAQCDENRGTSLWLVPANGAAPTRLTAANNGKKGPDIGDENAWTLPSGTFVQALGGCGVEYLAKVNPDGTTTKVNVPGTRGSVDVIGANGADLYLHANVPCSGGTSLIDYNPATNTSTVLLGPLVNGGAVIDTVLYRGERR
jgi:TolB protein